VERAAGSKLGSAYRDFIQQRDAEALSADEQTELIAVSDQIEEANARRIECLVQLADVPGKRHSSCHCYHA
jgi:hypothetical protein